MWDDASYDSCRQTKEPTKIYETTCCEIISMMWIHVIA